MVSSPVSAGSQVFARRLGWDSMCWTCTSLCCSSQVWLFKQKPESLDPLVKYHSCTSGLGKCYVEPRKVNGEGASCCRGLGWGSVTCFAWEGWCQGWPVPGLEGRCLLNAEQHGRDVGLSAVFPRVTPGLGWNLEDKGSDD